MNKNLRFILFSTGFFILVSGIPALAMHNLIFRATQVLGAGYCMNDGIQESLQLYKAKQKGLKEIEETVQQKSDKVSPIVEEWITKELKKKNINAATPIFKDSDRWNDDGLGVTFDKAILIPWRGAYILGNALWHVQDGQSSFEDEKIIARKKIILAHEISHLKNKDSQQALYMHTATPFFVQGISSMVSSGWNKLWRTQSPKTVKSSVLRSCYAAGSIPVKLLLAGLGMVGFNRYQEKRADHYACKSAESRLELEEFAQMFDEHEKSLSNKNPAVMIADAEHTIKNVFLYTILYGYVRAMSQLNADEAIIDPKSYDRTHRLAHFIYDSHHPWPADRFEMVHYYLDEWDKNHPEKIN